MAYSRNLETQEVEKKELKFPSESGRIREASSKILESLSRYKVSDATAFDIKLCIEEAVRNAIIHGNKSEPKRKVKVAYWVDGGALNIEVEDEGPGFDPKAVKDPTKDENLGRNSGRGVYLIKKLMDKVEYNPVGNKVVMTKKLK